MPDRCARSWSDALATEDVLAVLKPIWTEKPETASRLRGRIEKVLDAAKAKGHRSGEKPVSVARASGPPAAEAAQADARPSIE